LLEAEKHPDGNMEIRKFVLDSAMLKLHSSGEWYALDGRMPSADLTVTGGRLGKLLNALGYEKDLQGWRDERQPGGELAGCAWEGKPDRMDGKLSLVIKNGQLLDVEPGATGRALGLSARQLPRRLLALDFTDLFGRALASTALPATSCSTVAMPGWITWWSMAQLQNRYLWPGRPEGAGL
jgi:uncharacterized protein YhdP